VSVQGRFVEASNATLLGETSTGELVIYKPEAGARPLWDFDASSLAQREVWTWRIDQALGLGIVPETALGTGPFGPGAVQRFVEAEADETVVALINRSDSTLWPIAVLDVVVNNADRKIGHILRAGKSQLWAIDHGLTFHPDDKLRTVLWGFAGNALPEHLVRALASLAEQLEGHFGEELTASLGNSEAEAVRHRVAHLGRWGVHPHPPEDRPAIPWPPY